MLVARQTTHHTNDVLQPNCAVHIEIGNSLAEHTQEVQFRPVCKSAGWRAQGEKAIVPSATNGISDGVLIATLLPSNICLRRQHIGCVYRELGSAAVLEQRRYA